MTAASAASGKYVSWTKRQEIAERCRRAANSCYNRALICARERELSRALPLLKKALQLDKTHKDARNLLGLIYFEMGDGDVCVGVVKAVEAGVLDIALTDNKGQLRHLTDLKGKVVLLDFHVFALEDSPARILTLRELYNKYQAQGFEVYQVSLDPDEHFWKQQTAALPWVSVRDADGVQSQQLMLYNVQTVPDFFLIDRDNNLVKRAAQIKDLEAEIKKLL